MSDIGLARGFAPSTPGRSYGTLGRAEARPSVAAVAGSRQDHERRASPASGSARSATAVNRFAVLRVRYGLR